MLLQDSKNFSSTINGKNIKRLRMFHFQHIVESFGHIEGEYERNAPKEEHGRDVLRRQRVTYDGEDLQTGSRTRHCRKYI